MLVEKPVDILDLLSAARTMCIRDRVKTLAFEGLSERLEAAFKRLKSKGSLNEADVRAAMRDVRMALLEADVSYKVAKDFTAKVTERAIGADVMESLTPAQMVIKIVNEELIDLMEMCIRDSEGITRQGVRDAIKRAEAQLFDMESKLKLASKFDEIRSGLTEICLLYTSAPRALSI